MMLPTVRPASPVPVTEPNPEADPTSATESPSAAGGHSAQENPALELRQVSGLYLRELATLLGVSKTAYCSWCAGAGTRAQHQEHLLQVLTLMKEAYARLGGDAAAVRRWLLTPLWPGGATPFELASGRKYRALRGAIIDLAVAQRSFRPVEPFRYTYRPLSRREIEDRLDRLRPHTTRVVDDKDQQ